MRAQDAAPAIELRDVTYGFGSGGKFEALLKDVNLQVQKGEAVVIVGLSGEGKTTLLKLMAGLIRPTKGSALIGGKDWQSLTSDEQAQIARKTGMLFQKNALFDSLTVGENVAFPLREVAGASEVEIEEAVRHYLQAVEIAHAKDLYPDEISGGMQKRLGIARALALKPDTVFYDDPTAGLDPITSRMIIQLIARLQREMKTTVVAVTNDMNRAYQLASRIAMVVDGELVMCGTPAETKSHPDPRVQQFIHGQVKGPLTVLQ